MGDTIRTTDVIGLIPAAGRGTRLGDISFSKEIYPIGAHGPGNRPKVVSHYLLERMAAAGIGKAYFILRSGKWDIPEHFEDGTAADIRLGYLVTDDSPSAAHTLDFAYPFVRDAIVAMGFPDILFTPPNLFTLALNRLREPDGDAQADAVLALLPANRPDKYDVVVVDESGGVTDIVIKPSEKEGGHSWVVAVWTPVFTEFMREFIAGAGASTGARELSVAHVFRAAIEEGLKVAGVPVPDGDSLDIGTPEDLERAAEFASRMG